MRTVETLTHNAQPAQIPTAPPGEKYFKLFREYTNRAEILGDIHESFFAAIELFAGRDCRERCESSGLSRLHLHYPAEYVNLLEAFVNHRLRRRMLEWSASIGRYDVGFENDFLVEDLLVVRVHYPHCHLGERPRATRTPRFHHRIRFGLSASIERIREAYDSTSTLRLPLQMYKYLRQRRKRAALPLPYRCHAPHLDSWLGQPISSLSVWLAIAGVDKDNSMCLYPETIGVSLPVGGSRFLGSGFCLPKPTRPEIRDGDLFVFSTDILHSSQLNISEQTRIALTTRIDPGTPTFSRESLWFVERWYSADGILAGRWQRKTIRGIEHCIARPAGQAELQPSRCIKIPAVFRVNEVYPVAQSVMIKENEKLAIQFDNKRILILRTEGQLRAFSATCPHDRYHIDDGYHDNCILTCPGHGLEFDVRTGKSQLKRYRLAMFRVCEKEGTIFLG